MKKCVNILLVCFLLILSVKSSDAQDPQFSQFYAAPLYISPSFAGATDGTRAVVNFRDQWPAIPGSFITYAMSIDHNFSRLKSGVGIMAVRDVAGSGRLGTTLVGAQYSYTIQINRKLQIRPGILFGYGQRNLKPEKLTFGDQVYYNTSSSTSIIQTWEQNTYTDFAASVLAYSNNYWFGTSVSHLTRPNESLLGVESNIPMHVTLYGGAKIRVNSRVGKRHREFLSPAFLYKSQEKYDQLDLGLYWSKEPLVLGVWYRGIPVLKAYKKGYQNNDAIIGMVGYQFVDLKIGYSYDFTISNLVSSTGGAHEVSVIFEFNQDQKLRKKRRRVIVPCPKF